MSTAFYPLGMKSYNNNVPQGGYASWKGDGRYSNPVGITSGNIRPLTNNDPTNAFPTGFGLPRPLKHYRKGISIPAYITIEDPERPDQYIDVEYAPNRQVQSSTTGSLIGQMIDKPGQFIVKPNTIDEKSGITKLDSDCKTCTGIGIVSDYMPSRNLTNNPNPTTENPLNCCNEERKALKRVLPASTNLSKNYFTTLQQYRQNRCQTYNQRVFNFVNNNGTAEVYELAEKLKKNPFVTAAVIRNSKPGEPLSLLNTYVAQCQPNTDIYDAVEIAIISQIIRGLSKRNLFTSEDEYNLNHLKIQTITGLIDYIKNNVVENNRELALELTIGFITNPYIASQLGGPSNPRGCKLVIYKPNNPQYAQQGAVTSSTRTFKQNVITIEKATAQRMNAINIGVAQGNPTNTPFLYKNKVQKCNPGLYTFNGNPKTCFRGTNDTNRL